MANITFDPQSLSQREDAAFAGYQISQIVLCSLFALALPLEYVGFAQYLYKVRCGQELNLWWLRISLFASSVIFTAFLAVVTVMAFATAVSAYECSALAKSYGALYVGGVITDCTFLLQKARVVGKFEISDKRYQFLFKSAQVSLVGMMPGGLVLTAVLAEGKLTPSGRCVQVFPMWFIWAFGALTSQLVLVLAYLFIYPIRRSVFLNLGSGGKGMHKLYVKNATISTVSTSITFVLFFAVYAPLHQIAASSLDDSYYAVAMASLAWTGPVTCAASRLTTNVWLPNGVRKLFFNKDLSISSSPNPASKSGVVRSPKVEHDSLRLVASTPPSLVM
ncbi:hypothetical protein BASA82_000640 [Batrachochytrium salamandrivorans]|nr:hypothetical protein BASA82_000640 [Batrachochytrium salamandrivorans]